METKHNDSNTLAIKYLGWTLILTIVFVGLYALATIGYNTYISFSQEKIEVQATNSNSTNKR